MYLIVSDRSAFAFLMFDDSCLQVSSLASFALCRKNNWTGYWFACGHDLLSTKASFRCQWPVIWLSGTLAWPREVSLCSAAQIAFFVQSQWPFLAGTLLRCTWAHRLSFIKAGHHDSWYPHNMKSQTTCENYWVRHVFIKNLRPLDCLQCSQFMLKSISMRSVFCNHCGRCWQEPWDVSYC